MCFQDDAPDTKKDFTGDPLQDKSLPWECCPSFHPSSYSPPSPFISFTKKETPTSGLLVSIAVHLTASQWEMRLQESPLERAHSFFGPLLRWWDVTAIGPTAFVGWGGGVLSLLAATSETTRHIRIRSIWAAAHLSRFMVSFHWNMTTLLVKQVSLRFTVNNLLICADD